MVVQRLLRALFLFRKDSSYEFEKKGGTKIFPIKSVTIDKLTRSPGVDNFTAMAFINVSVSSKL